MKTLHRSHQAQSQQALEQACVLHLAARRAGLALSVITALFAFAIRAGAQTTEAALVSHHAAVPYSVGEELVYHATFGKLPAGTARMRVQSIDTVRGRPAYHVTFALDGGVPLFRVHDSYESWIDVETLSSLRYRQHISEGRYHRNTTYELYPDRALYQKDSEPLAPSVSNPLDDGSFVYAVRALGLRVGDTVRNERYFQPNKNPVVLTGLREETVTVPTGTYAATVVRPTIKTSGIFSEDGRAEIWFSNDDRRLPVQVKTHFAHFSLLLTLESMSGAETPSTSVAKR